MTSWMNLMDIIYPVGSIYLSASNASPANIIGGSWKQITEKFLFAAGENYACGQTGGEEKHTLITDEIPSHTHDINLYYHSNGGGHRGVNRSQWSDANDSGGRFVTGSRGGARHTTICRLIMSFIFGREFLSTRGGAK